MPLCGDADSLGIHTAMLIQHRGRSRLSAPVLGRLDRIHSLSDSAHVFASRRFEFQA